METDPQQAAKTALRLAIQPTSRGRRCTPAQRQQIYGCIETLERVNPTPEPTSAPTLLNGNWRTLYTTSQDLIQLGTRLPGFTTGEIYQLINVERHQVINVAEIEGAFGFLNGLASIVAVNATFQVLSAQRVQVSFRQLLLGNQLLMNYEINSFLHLLQHQPDQIAALKIPIPSGRNQGWLDITYLDQDLRIGRGSEGSLFVLERC